MSQSLPADRSSPVLVTGGSGFIGTHLCRKLIQNGYSVTVLDLVDPKKPVAGVKYTRGDVRDRMALERSLRDVSAVCHLAAVVSVPLCQEQPVLSYETNFLATAYLLDGIRSESKRQGRKLRVSFASTAAIYGNPEDDSSARSESMIPPWPISFYAAQKLASEQAIRLYHQAYGLPAAVFRCFNVFGPGQDPSSPYSGVISIFSKSVLAGKSLRLNGGGIQTRDFISVHDVVDAFVRSLTLSENLCDGIAMNLGTGQSVSIRALAETLVQVAGNKNIRLEETPSREGDVLHSLADVRRAKNLLGWEARVSLSDGLSELLESMAKVR